MSEHTQQAAGSGEKTIQFSSFYLADCLYGLDIQDIKEINNETNFTRIPHAQSEVRGYVNIRGQVYLIFDLRTMLGFDAVEIDGSSKIILFKPHVGSSFGVLIDRIGDVIEVNEGFIEPREQKGDQAEALKLVTGTCKLETQLLTVLDAKLFLASAESENN